MEKITENQLKPILKSILLWGLGVWFVVIICIRIFPYDPSFPYATALLPQFGSRELTSFAQFDGVHYLGIIKEGYHAKDYVQAFFPFYPVLIRYLSFNSLINPIIVSLTLNFCLLIASIIIISRLMKLDNFTAKFKHLKWLLLLFPTSFYFLCLYTESLFFLLLLLCFYFSRQHQWSKLILVGYLAGLTRFVGVFLIFSFIYELWLENKFQKITFVQVIACLSPLLGLFSYMTYLQIEHHDALMFIHVQDNFGVSRDTTRFILLPQVFYRYTKMLLTLQPTFHGYYVVIQELFSAILGLVTLTFSWFKFRKSYTLFAIPAFILPTLTGTFTSLPRYLVVLFPILLVLANLPKKWYLLTCIIFSIMLLINLSFFTQGLWVS